MVVSNASPLIALAKAGLIELLPTQFARVQVPQAVVEAFMQGPEHDPIRKMINNLKWLQHVSLDPCLTPLACWQLGRGESEVIEYARRNPGTIALLDDRDARSIAAVLSIPVIGTLGIVAKSARGNVNSFDRMIRQLQEAGLYLDASVISKVRKGLESVFP